MSTRSQTPARAEAETITDTPFGGRVSAWTEVARLWLDLTPGAERDVASGGAPPLRIETATAVARDDARLTRGMRLLIGDEAPWIVTAAARAHPAPGRMTVRLERTA